MPGHQVVAKPELHHRLLHLGRRGAVLLGVHQCRDLPPGPELVQAALGSAAGEGEIESEGRASSRALDAHLAAESRDARHQHDGLGEIQIRHARGPGLGAGAREVHLDAAERRALELPEEAAHLLAHLLGRADPGRGPPAEERRLAHEERVGRRSDPDRKEPAAAEVALDPLEECALVADGPVGDEHDLANGRSAAGADAIPQRQVEGALHVGASVRHQVPDVGARLLTREGRRGDALGKQGGRARGEGDHVEGVVGGEALDREVEGRAGLGDRGPVHRARDVDHEDGLARQRMDGLRSDVRRHHHQEYVGLALERLAEERRRRGGSHLRLPLEHEVGVRRRDAVGQGDADVAGRAVLGPDRVGRARHPGERQARVEAHLDPARVAAIAPRGNHGRRDAGRVGNLVGVGSEARPGESADGPAPRDEARPHDERESEREEPGPVVELLLVLDAHGEPLVRTEVGHLGGEHVGPFLLDEGRAASLARRLFVLAPRLLLLLDHALDLAIAHDHVEGVHGGVLGEREHVDPLDPLLGGVLEGLGDPCASDDAGDLDLDERLEQRGALQPIAAADQEAPGLDLVECHGRTELDGRAAGPFGDDHGDGNGGEEEESEEGNRGAGAGVAFGAHGDPSAAAARGSAARFVAVGGRWVAMGGRRRWPGGSSRLRDREPRAEARGLAC